MRIPDSKRTVLIATLAGAIVSTIMLPASAVLLAQEGGKGGEAEQKTKNWAAAAPGRVEPRSREIRLAAPSVSRIQEVLVHPNDSVFAGELLIRLEDAEALARVAGTEAQVAMRRRARDEQSVPRGAAERRRAEAGVEDAERAVIDARNALDGVSVARRSGGGSDAAVEQGRLNVTRALERLKQQQAELRRVRADPDTPLPTRTEGELNAARADLTSAEAALERTRIRAPIGGMVLQVQAKPGELAMPSPEQALVVMGDVSTLRVRAELDERDIGQVKVGQPAVVRADAFRGREFGGRVASIARWVGPGTIGARGGRKLGDVDVIEVMVDLSDPGPLAVGMQVDVYFRADASR